MRSLSLFDWPFFDESHRRFAMDLARWADRALRIYEGATEVQKVVIARDILKSHSGNTADRPRQREGAR